jgi:hypothetical protein
MTSNAQGARFVLPPDALHVLGSFASAPLGAMSVLSASQVSTEMSRSLTAAGALDSDGRPSAPFAPVLDVLAAPTGLAQLHLTGGESLIEIQIHTGAAGTVSVLSTSEGLELAAPADVDRMVRVLTEHLGFSMLPSLTLSAQLTAEDAVVFAATVDHHRRRLLAALLAGEALSDAPADDGSVRALLQVDDPRWLVPIVSALAGDIPQGAAAARVGHLSSDVNQVARALALRFAVFDRIFTLVTVGSGTDGETMASQVACVQAGVHDLLVIEAGPDGLGFVTLPSAMVLSRVATMLADPGGELREATPTQAPHASFCPRCGTAFQVDGTFCTTCGARRPDDSR